MSRRSSVFVAFTLINMLVFGMSACFGKINVQYSYESYLETFIGSFFFVLKVKPKVNTIRDFKFLLNFDVKQISTEKQNLMLISEMDHQIKPTMKTMQGL